MYVKRDQQKHHQLIVSTPAGTHTQTLVNSFLQLHMGRQIDVEAYSSAVVAQLLIVLQETKNGAYVFSWESRAPTARHYLQRAIRPRSPYPLWLQRSIFISGFDVQGYA